MSLSTYYLNQRITTLQNEINGLNPSGSSNLEQVLTNGNDANGLDIIGVDNLAVTTINGSVYPPVIASDNLSSVLTAGNTATNSISLNNTGTGTNVISLLPNASASNPNIQLTDGTTTNTIDKNGYTTRNSVQNSTHFLNFSDSSATGTGSIQKTAGLSCNPSTNTITATTFVGNLSGNSTTSTHLAGGIASQIPYQTGVGTTSFITNGASNQYLKSNGTSAPTWSDLPSTIKVSTLSSPYTLAVKNVWTKIGTITNTSAFSQTGTYFLNWGLSTTDTTLQEGYMFNTSSGITAYSFDGSTWSVNQTIGSLGIFKGKNFAKYFPELKRWILTTSATTSGTSGNIAYSWDGINFIQQILTSGTMTGVNSVAYSPSLDTYVYAGAGSVGNLIQYSDAIGGGMGQMISTGLTNFPASPTTVALWVGGGINKFLVGGASSATTSAFYYSSDGKTNWLPATGATINIAGRSPRVIATNTANSHIIAVGSAMSIVYSTTGTDFSTVTFTSGGSNNGYAIAYRNTPSPLWVVGGQATNAVISYSTDGINFTTTSTIYAGVIISSVGYNETIGKFVATIPATGVNYGTSTDGINWSWTTSPVFANGTTAGIIAGNSQMSSGTFNPPKNMSVGVVVKNTSTGTSMYPTTYGASGGNGLGATATFNTLGGATRGSDTINISSYTAGAMDIEVWAKLPDVVGNPIGEVGSSAGTLNLSISAGLYN